MATQPKSESKIRNFGENIEGDLSSGTNRMNGSG